MSYGTDDAIASLYQAKGLGPAAGNGWYTADKDEPICDTMGIEHHLISDDADVAKIKPAIDKAYTESYPVALLIGRRPS